MIADRRLQIVDSAISSLCGAARKHLLACGSVVLSLYLLFVISLAERNNEQQEEVKVPLRIMVSSPLYKPAHKWSKHD